MQVGVQLNGIRIIFDQIPLPGWTPLHEACNHGHFNVASILIKSGANVNAKGYEDVTPLHDAALVGQLKMVKLLLSHGADPKAKNAKGKAPLDLACAAVYHYIKGMFIVCGLQLLSKIRPIFHSS